MTKYFIIFFIGIFAFNSGFAQNSDNPMDSLSYSLGVLVAQNLKQQGFEGVDAEVVAKGISDVLNNSKLAIDEAQANMVIKHYLQEQKAAKYKDNLEAGKQFLAKNAKKDGVTTLPSGLQYSIIKQGEGPVPTRSDKVKTHYHGTLIDGTVFDSSVERGEPISFPVTGVIAGWTEALQLMPVGSKWKLYIPYDLAYGERGAGPTIGPYTTLIFEVELLDIE